MTVATLADLEHLHVVLRPFGAEGRVLERGEVVDTSQWRSIQPLIGNRRLAHLLSPEGRAAVSDDYQMPMVQFGESTEIEPESAEVTPKPRPRGRPRKIREDA